MEINYKDIGNRIRELRVNKNLTQESFAERVEISVAHTSHIETGNTKLSLPTLVRIANALEVSLDDILCDSMRNATVAFSSELADLMDDCSSAELAIITDTVKALKSSLRKRGST